MRKNNSLRLISALLMLSLAACAEMGVLSETGGDEILSQDTSEGPFRLAQLKDDVNTYRKFIHNHPNSKYLPQAINRMGELLAQEGVKEKLEAYVESFPQYKHTVAKALDELQLLEKVNEHMNETEEVQKDNRYLKIRKGELFYAHHYFKAFVRLEDSIGMDAEYEMRIDKSTQPKFIEVILLPGVSFAMEESFHSMVNVRYKIMVAKSAPVGKYKLEITFGTYRKEDNEWVRKDGSGIVHEIEVVDNTITDPEELRVDFRSVKYFAEKEAEANQALKYLRPPTKEEFGNYYMYAYDLARLTVEVEKYRTYQAIALYHLYQASRDYAPTLSGPANEYLQQLGPQRPELEFIPFEVNG